MPEWLNWKLTWKVLEILHKFFQTYLLLLLLNWFQVFRVSLVVHTVKNLPAMQETWVWSLVWEDPTCREATKPVGHNYWTGALEPRSRNYWSPCALQPVLCNDKPPQWEASALQLENSPCSLQLEKSLCSNKDPACQTNNKIFLSRKTTPENKKVGVTLSPSRGASKCGTGMGTDNLPDPTWSSPSHLQHLTFLLFVPLHHIESWVHISFQGPSIMTLSPEHSNSIMQSIFFYEIPFR